MLTPPLAALSDVPILILGDRVGWLVDGPGYADRLWRVTRPKTVRGRKAMMEHWRLMFYRNLAAMLRRDGP